MTKVVDYDYIQEISAEDALKNSASDVTSWYNWNVPGVNTFKINAETSIYNEQWWGSWIAGWSTNVSWSATDYNTVSWGSWDINLPDWTTLTVTSGNTGNMSATTYIYYDREDDTVKYTTTSADSVWEKKILLCVAAPTVSWKDAEFQAFGTNAQSTFIHADQIAANTITANEIASNTITASQIQSHTITANEMSVYQLSSITANLWDVTVGNNNDSKIRIYPNWNQGRIDFSYEWTAVWSMIWTSVAWVGDTLAINWGSSWTGNIALNGKVYCIYRLRLPVGRNMYN